MSLPQKIAEDNIKPIPRATYNRRPAVPLGAAVGDCPHTIAMRVGSVAHILSVILFEPGQDSRAWDRFRYMAGGALGVLLPATAQVEDRIFPGMPHFNLPLLVLLALSHESGGGVGVEASGVGVWELFVGSLTSVLINSLTVQTILRNEFSFTV